MHLLITSVRKYDLGSVPAVLNKTSLDLVWLNEDFFVTAAYVSGRWDSNTGDLFWFSDRDCLLKLNYTGEMLIKSYTQLDADGTDFVLHRYKEVIVRSWRNATSVP